MKPCGIWIIVLIVGLAGGCATGDLLGNFNLISPQQEQQLGEQLSQEIAGQRALVNDSAVLQYVQAIGGLLVSVSLHPNDPYAFHVLKDEEVNAFAIPGGHLYVMTGLLLQAENEAEVAAVLAHELGHTEKRHPTQALSRRMGAEVLMQIVLGENPGATQKLAADLLAIEETRDTAGPPLFASHPPTQERIFAASQLILNLGPQRSHALERIGSFRNVQDRVRALP